MLEGECEVKTKQSDLCGPTITYVEEWLGGLFRKPAIFQGPPNDRRPLQEQRGPPSSKQPAAHKPTREIAAIGSQRWEPPPKETRAPVPA